jgi:hypothetical protein
MKLIRATVINYFYLLKYIFNFSDMLLRYLPFRMEQITMIIEQKMHILISHYLYESHTPMNSEPSQRTYISVQPLGPSFL